MCFAFVSLLDLGATLTRQERRDGEKLKLDRVAHYSHARSLCGQYFVLYVYCVHYVAGHIDSSQVQSRIGMSAFDILFSEMMNRHELCLPPGLLGFYSPVGRLSERRNIDSEFCPEPPS